jgi:capsular exopolysaccharide synthesis family protein
MVKLRAQIEMTQQKLSAELGKMVTSVQNELKASQALESRLSAALEAQKNEALGLDRKRIQFNALQREVASNQEVFQNLLQRARETGIAGENKSNNVRIVDAAEVPQSPVAPVPMRNMAFGIMLGAILAVAFGFFFEYLDDRIKTPDDIKNQLRLPVLGLLPLVRFRRHGKVRGLLNSGVPPVFAEALRTVRTNVLFAVPEKDRTLVVTSTGPSEGKTSVACNLAVGLAMTGQRVLLLDLDMRRPRVHKIFNISQGPGFSDVMRGRAELADAIHPTTIPALSVLTSGATPPNPTEILSAPTCREAIGGLAAQFDWVIMDSPPVMAVADASIVAHLASAVVFVVGAEQTSRASAINAVDQLDGANATFVGVVLNRVNLARNAFYYGHYYRREYGAYYRTAKGA